MKYKTWKTINLEGTVSQQQLEDAGVTVGSYASDMLKKVVYSNTGSIDLTVVTVAEIGFSNGATTKEIFEKAKEEGLELCPAEVGPQLRMQYLDQPKDEYLYIAMEPIADRNGDPYVFKLYRGGGGLWLHRGIAGPDDRWRPVNRIVFSLRKSAVKLELSDSETLPLGVFEALAARVQKLEDWKKKLVMED